MAVFSCPECGALSQSNRKANYYWCACGCPLTTADAVPGMADSPKAAEPAPDPTGPEQEHDPELPELETQA